MKVKGKVTLDLVEYDKLRDRVRELENLITSGVEVVNDYGNNLQVEFSLNVFSQYIIDQVEDKFPEAEIDLAMLKDTWYKASRTVANLPKEELLEEELI